MKSLLATAASLATMAALAAPAQALDLNAMTEAEKEAFGKAVRSYVMENPSLIIEAYEVYQAQQAALEAAGEQAILARLAPQLLDDARAWETGNPDGDIVMIEFLDYRCGYCKKAHEDVKALIAGDDNIRFIVKEFPILGDESVLASQFAIATRLVAGDDAYGQMNDALMAHRGRVSEASLTKIADKLGLDGDAIYAMIDAPEVTQLIADNRQIANALSISGTPTFVLQDQLLRGYVPLAGMQELVAEIRAEM